MKKIALEMMNSTTMKTNNWWESEWYRKWEQLADESYHGERAGYWICYYNEENELTYRYVDM